MNLSRLKWVFLATLVVLFVFVEFARYNLMPFLDSWQGRLLMDLVILVASLFFFGIVFGLMSRMQARVERQNRELLALHRAGLDLSGDLSLDTVLEKVVQQAHKVKDKWRTRKRRSAAPCRRWNRHSPAKRQRAKFQRRS